MTTVLCTPPRVRKSLQTKRSLTDHKRVLFPTNSPDGCDDINQLANSLSSSPSVYSPPLPSPSWSWTPPKICSPGNKWQLDSNYEKVTRSPEISWNASDKLDSPYRNSPRRSPRNFKTTPKFTNVDILTMLDGPEKGDLFQNEMNKSSDFVTPKSMTKTSPNSKRKSPVIKPSCFYGNSASLLAKNEANAVAGIKKIYRVSVDSKAKTRLFSDSKATINVQRRSHHSHSHKLKKRKEMFTGVGHSLKPIKVEKRKRALSESDTQNESYENSKTQANSRPKKKVNIRDQIYDSFDFTRMPYSKQKCKKGWCYPVLKFTKPERMDIKDESAGKRKYFKTTLKSPGRVYFGAEMESPVAAKKRKLLNPGEDFLNTSDLTNASDILDLIEDGRVIEQEDKEIKEGVDDLILHLDDELQQQENELEISENLDTVAVECGSNELNMSNLSISGDAAEELPKVNENITHMDKENDKRTPKKLFPLFEKHPIKFVDITNRSSEKRLSNSANKKWISTGEDQYQIDAGQKRFGATQCSTCGIVYQLGDPEDEKEHEKYHRNFKTFKHMGWQNEKVVGQFGLDRVILVTADNKMWWKKVLILLKSIDHEIGYTTEENNVLTNLKVYLYINNKQIVGCLVATYLSHAYKMLICEPGIDVCSEDSFPVKCGISRLWTHPLHRRQGIATRLIDSMRASFYFGYYLTVDDFAFSVPTEDGKALAKKYTKKPDYLVFTGW